MTKEAVLTKPFRIGISSRQVIKAGTVVTIVIDNGRFVLERGNFRGLIPQDSFRWSDQQQMSLFGGKP